ncbi:hypothetical protein Dimus_000079 [Dionaea muscipula]
MKEELDCTGTGTGGGGLGVSNKGYPPDGPCGGVELGLKIKEERPTFLCNQSGGGGDGDGHGPTFKEMGTPYLSSTYHFAASARDSTTVSVPVVSSTTVGDDGVTGTAAVRSPLQPFNISYPAYPFFKSPGGGRMATFHRFFPFTTEQWKELQRQAMIYKYMVACVPVPHDLLFPIVPSGSASPWGKMGVGNVRWAGSDAEPGRCKRTDGKKWRCSKDVAPNQKYCERHLNRGRPRSRKHVEIHTDFPIDSTETCAKKTRLGDPQISSRNLPNLKAEAHGSSSATQFIGLACSVQGFDGNQGSTDSHFAASMVSLPLLNKEPRCLNWLARDEGAEEQWRQMELKSAGLLADGSLYNTNSSVFQHPYANEPTNSNSFLNFNCDKANQDGQDCCFASTSTPARGFIDAWSNGVPQNENENGSRRISTVSSNGKISPSSLALSMGGSNLTDDAMCRIHMGLGVDSTCNSPVAMKDQVLSTSWVPSNANPGGPLAEVLKLRSVATDPTCPDPENSDFVTPPSTMVSSPSGVLQKTLASFSDSSGSNSPICDERKAKPQISFQWLS